MRGVILAGGTGTRLLPMTRATNKHLLNVYDRPMIHWPLKILLDNGITDIMVVTGREHAGAVFALLGSGAEFGCEFTYRVQDEAGGIAQALLLAEDFVVDRDRIGCCAVVLGDTVMLPSPLFDPHWHSDIAQGAMVFVQQVPKPEAYGVVAWRDGRDETTIEAIVEKPVQPPSAYAVAGLYLYDASVFEAGRDQKPSARGELEISDVNNAYASSGYLAWQRVPGYWGDAGTVEGLFEAANHVRIERALRGPLPMRAGERVAWAHTAERERL